MNDPISFSVLEMNDTTDKLNINLSYIRGQLSAMRVALEDVADTNADTAMSLAFAADHFVDLLQNDLDALTEAVEEKKEATK
jgi:hypothetical protein